MGGFNFEFIIPLNRDDLLSAQSADQYYVSEVYKGRDLEVKLKGIIMYNFFASKR